MIDRSYQKLSISFILLLLSSHSALAVQLDDFSSDGCSQFPDGTLAKKNLWCDCCINHDVAYWQGGNREQKKQADESLRKCVEHKTGSSLLADTMFYAVTVGGSPVFPTEYRWGYGWRYGRGFQSLNRYEKQQVKERMQLYQILTPQFSCDFEHPVKVHIKAKWQQLMDEQE